MPRSTIARHAARRLADWRPDSPLGGAVLATACASNPVTGQREVSLISEAEEIEIGRRGDAEIRREMGVYDDDELQRYVSGVGERIAGVSHRPNLPWTFTVLDAPAVNAFALPGGFVYVTRGLLAHLGDEAELAGVIGHEVGHVTARHVSQQYTRSAGGINGRAAGQHLRARRRRRSAIWPASASARCSSSTAATTSSNPTGSASSTRPRPDGIPPACRASWRRCRASTRSASAAFPNWLSTHPNPGSRVVKAQPIAERAADGTAAERNREEYLQTRRRPGLRRRSGRGRRPRPPVPASRPAHRHRLPRRLGGAQRAPSRSWPGSTTRRR